MEDLNLKTNEELIELTKGTEDKDVLRAVAEKLELKFSGNTGVETLKEKILTHLHDDVDDPVLRALKAHQAAPPAPKSADKFDLTKASKAVLADLDPSDETYTETERRLIVTAKAMRLHRVKITNIDPNDAPVPGAIKTVYNKYVGKVSKYIPYGEENELGYHVPEILLNSLKEETFNMRKEIKNAGSSFGVKQYRTIPTKKYAIEYLPDLTEEEIEELARDQKVRGAIDAA